MVLPDGDTRWLARAIEHCDYLRVSVRIVHESILALEIRDSDGGTTMASLFRQLLWSPKKTPSAAGWL